LFRPTSAKAAYEDKIDGKISEDFWKRKMDDWRAEEKQVQASLDSLQDADNCDPPWMRSGF
jgi:hypothetical protein